jgi:single-stranded DNA-binding protein
MFSALLCGNLAADPARHEGAKGHFVTGLIRVQPSQGDAFIASIIAFGERGDELLLLDKGDSISATGRASLRSWTGRDGASRYGINVVVDRIAAFYQQRPRTSRRRDVSMARPNHMTGSPLPSDRVDDLWREPTL